MWHPKPCLDPENYNPNPRKAYGDQAKYFKDEIFPQMKHKEIGTVGMASTGEDANCSQALHVTAQWIDPVPVPSASLTTHLMLAVLHHYERESGPPRWKAYSIRSGF